MARVSRRSRAAALAASVAALIGLTASEASAGSAQADARLDRALRGIVALPQGPPGVSAVVQRGRELRIHTAGRAKLGRRGPIRGHQHMRIASTTKAFTGAVLMRLVDRGRLSLGTTVGEVLPAMPPSWHPITLRQLLYHTSGLPNYTATPAFQAYFGDHLADYYSPQSLIDFAATEDLEFAPGSSFEYSNTDNIVMAMMAESLTGARFKRLLGRLVLNPLRLRNTSFPQKSLRLPRPYVRGYLSTGPDSPPIDFSSEISPSGAWSSGGIVSTPLDLNRFIRAWGGGGLLRSPKLRRAQTAFLSPFTGSEPPGPGQNQAGLTLYRYRTPCGAVFGHTGNFPGYTQWMASSPNGKRSAVVSANMALSPPATGSQQAFQALRRIFRRAACAALSG